MMWKIAKIGDYETTDFAALELKRYLNKMDPSNDYMILDCKKYDSDRKDVLWVGYTPEFPVPEVEDAKFDDGISISVKKNAGYITGTNARSVLIAVYRFLRELGCAFVRPGELGEIIPALELKDVDVQIFEKASYRHRVMCLDGTTSYDHMVNMIDWLPKVGMNAFLSQDHLLYGNYRTWYQSEFNPMFEGEAFTHEDTYDMTKQSIVEMKRRGILFHSGAHRWTCGAFGARWGRWDKSFEELPAEFRENVALIDGKRELYKGGSIITNLCYKTEYVLEKLAKEAVRFCREYPETDVLHFWLADGYNNHCECEKCKDVLPADLYIDVLNRVDEELTKENIDVKISLVVYDDLLWAPEKSKLNNEDRFILHFAPITRGYADTLANAEEFKGELPAFVKNKLNFPYLNSEILAHLKNWQKAFHGDSYDFDYHFMWEHFTDFGYAEFSKLVFNDIATLDKNHLNGLITCQSMRCFFPSSLPMIAMAEALWDKNTDYDEMADRYYSAAFGKDADKARAYLEDISSTVNIRLLGKLKDKVVSPEVAEKQVKILARIDAFVPEISAHAADDTLSDSQRLSWKYLIYHAELCKLAATSFLLLAKGEIDKAKEKMEEVKAYPKSVLKEIHDVIDDRLFSYVINDRTSGLWYWAGKGVETMREEGKQGLDFVFDVE